MINCAVLGNKTTGFSFVKLGRLGLLGRFALTNPYVKVKGVLEGRSSSSLEEEPTALTLR